MKKYFDLLTTKTKIKCLIVIALAVVSSVLASIWPVKLGELYTNISNGNISTVSKGVIALVAFGAVYLLSEGITIFRRIMIDYIISTHEAELRVNSIGKLLKMPVKYTHGNLSGETTAKLNQGIAGLSQLIRIMCNEVVATLLTACFTLVQVLLNAPTVMAIIMIAYLFITIIFSVNQIKSQNGVRENIIKKKSGLDGEICQSISNLEMIRSLGAEGYEKERLKPIIFKICKIENNHHLYMSTFDSIKQACKIIFQIIILGVSIVLISKNQMSAGAVITVSLLFQQLVKPVDDVYRFMDDTASSGVKAKILTEINSIGMDSIYEIESTQAGMIESDIVLKNVAVTTPDGEKVLAKYNDITIPFGKKVALKGANGCGKTTLIRCLNRYYPHVSGDITLFGKKQEEYSQKELTNILYYSPQVSFFVAGSIRDNLLYGLEDVCDEELIYALGQVKLYGNYEGVIAETGKEALEFVISEGAKELSGGMRQRLALARAFLHKPKLFVFDEITANLDEKATNYVLSNIENYAKSINAGIVYISHESNVVNRCDLVIQLDNVTRFDDAAITAA
ncbi:MAG: ABC transporter ATP-binding protein/permease [Lachnospiraceae bacterium]|nr:ABC transporter ATP-binding protein/permease [Lachnospiraceae bacterium]